ncbi:MAG TPA: 2-dehydro-3-deoxygalactonokinase [Verrucomicrobiales bacterium]|nr:2-dehydro-3-deoxygalactonokinase [Verrucomicrobiales bacterium]
MEARILCCDWGTSRFRLRLLETGSVSVLGEFTSDAGVAGLSRRGEAAFQEILLDAISRILRDAPPGPVPSQVLISGMAASSIGWRELPYAALPFPLDGGAVIALSLAPLPLDPPIGITLISGVRSEDDVLRGEETEAIGLLAGRLDRELLLVLPGTHSKHLYVAEGELRGFRTFLTGELFSLLASHGILRYSVRPGPPQLADPLEAEAFASGLHLGANGPLTHVLFQVRTAALLDGASPGQGRARLDGILIGAELSSLRLHRMTGTPATLPLLIAAGPALAPSYRLAVRLLGLDSHCEWVSPHQADLASAQGQLHLATRLGLC